MEFGKEVEDRYSAGDLQNMFYKDDNEDGSKLAFSSSFFLLIILARILISGGCEFEPLVS